MAALRNGVSKYLPLFNSKFLRPLVPTTNPMIQATRNNTMFEHLQQTDTHNEKYAYEISKDPEEWKYVERLMFRKTVPTVSPKEEYPSGWRPATAKPNDHPYFVERSRNHMLSVYLLIRNNGDTKITIIRKVRGDIWALHEDLLNYISENCGHKVASFVHESNCSIHFRGDRVYHAEQFLLKKGF